LHFSDPSKAVQNRSTRGRRPGARAVADQLVDRPTSSRHRGPFNSRWRL
jgi:hypothetical protein